MRIGPYNIALAAITVALLGLWFIQPGWGGLELFALYAIASPIYAPLFYRLGVYLWVARQRRRFGLPAASDRDLIDFVGEELDRADIEWHWRVGWRGTRGDEIEIGDDEADDLAVKARNGVLMVYDSQSGTSRFVDPVAAVDHAMALYAGPARTDAAVFVDTAEDDT